MPEELPRVEESLALLDCCEECGSEAPSDESLLSRREHDIFWDGLSEYMADGRVVVYTDGACRNNQDARFRRAGVGVFSSIGHALDWSSPLAGHCQTNQRAELEAVRFALRAEQRPVEIRSDSQYVVDGCNRHRYVWRKLGWRPASHVDLWQEVDKLLEDRPDGEVRISKVERHAKVL